MFIAINKCVLDLFIAINKCECCDILVNVLTDSSQEK